VLDREGPITPSPGASAPALGFRTVDHVADYTVGRYTLVSHEMREALQSAHLDATTTPETKEHCSAERDLSLDTSGHEQCR
jgi:hypothetical protein